MKNQIIITILFSILLLTNCQTKENYDKYITRSDGLIPEYTNLNEGDNITIKYKVKDTTDIDDLFLKAYISTNNLETMYVMIIKFTEKNPNMLKASFIIPQNTNSIEFNLFKKRTYFHEYCNIPVFSNGKPKKYSLFNIMRGAKNLKRFEELYSLDKKYYPHSYFRETINIETMVRGHSDTNNIREYISELQNEFKANSSSMELIDILNFHSIMSYIFTQFDDSLNSIKNLYAIDSLLHLYPKYKLAPITLAYLINTFYLINKNSENDSLYFAKYNPHRILILQFYKYTNDISFFRDLCNAAIKKLYNKKLYNYYKQLYDTMLAKINLMIPELSYKNIYKKIYAPDMFWVFYKINYLAKNYNKCIMILLKGIEIFEESKSKDYSGQQYIEDINADNGILSSMRLLLGNLYLEMRDTTKAILIYKELLRKTDNNMYNIGPLSLANHKLTMISIQKNNIVNAKKNLFTASVLKDPEIMKLIDAFRNRFGSLGSSFIKDIINSTKKNSLALDNDIKKIKTRKGVFDISQYPPNKFIFLATINDECLACNLSLNSLINDILHKKEDKYKIILISKKKIELPVELQNNNRISFSKETHIADKYNTEHLYPHMLVIYQHKIIFSINSFPRTLDELLSSNLNLKK